MSEPMNIVVIVADTFRTSFLGAYGNDWIHTPNLNQFAEEGVRFTNAHPECLPTIPTRRTLHTGRRAFPFKDYSPVPWDNVYLAGWQPMSGDEGYNRRSTGPGWLSHRILCRCPPLLCPWNEFYAGLPPMGIHSRPGRGPLSRHSCSRPGIDRML